MESAMKDRIYTTAELDRMDAAGKPERRAAIEAPGPAAEREDVPSIGGAPSGGIGGGKEFVTGVRTAATRPWAGILQSKAYLTGTPEERAELNEAIQLMELEAEPALGTLTGKIGEMGMTAAPLIALPGARATVPRAAVTGAVTGAVQPVAPVGTDLTE